MACGKERSYKWDWRDSSGVKVLRVADPGSISSSPTPLNSPTTIPRLPGVIPEFRVKSKPQAQLVPSLPTPKTVVGKTLSLLYYITAFNVCVLRRSCGDITQRHIDDNGTNTHQKNSPNRK